MKKYFILLFIFLLSVCASSEYWYELAYYMSPTGTIVTNSFTAHFTTDVELVEEHGSERPNIDACDWITRNGEIIYLLCPYTPPWWLGGTWDVWLDEYTNMYQAISGGTNSVTFIRTNGPAYIPFSKLYTSGESIRLIFDFTETLSPEQNGLIPFVYGDFDSLYQGQYSWEDCVNDGINADGTGPLNLTNIDTNFYAFKFNFYMSDSIELSFKIGLYASDDFDALSNNFYSNLIGLDSDATFTLNISNWEVQSVIKPDDSVISNFDWSDESMMLIKDFGVDYVYINLGDFGSFQAAN